MIRKSLVVLLLGVIAITAILLMKQQVKTLTVGEYEAMPHIDMTMDVLNIKVAESPDDKIHVQLQGYKINQNMLTIREENNTFILNEAEQKKSWRDNFQFRPRETVIVQLPKSQTKTLVLNDADGNITIQNLTLDTVEVQTTAGVAHVKNLTAANAKIESKDGNIKIENSTIEGLKITSTAGDVAVNESTGSASTIQTIDGQIKMTEATEQPNLQVKSVSGMIGINYKNVPTSLQIATAGPDINIKLPAYDQKTHLIGQGANKLAAETKDGAITIKSTKQ